MKLHKLLLSAFLSLALVIPSAAATVSNAAVISDADAVILEDDTEAASLETYGAQLRGLFKSRKTSFKMNIPTSLISTTKDVDKMVEIALRETSSPTEGDYIRWHLSKYTYTGKVENDPNTYVFNFDVEYFSTAEQEKAVDSEIKKIISSLNVGSGSDYEVIRAVYTWITQHTDYAEDDTTGNNIYSAYGAAVEHKAVCHGFSAFTYRLLRELGINCRIIPGMGNSSQHAWNIVNLDNNYYYLDTTWDCDSSPSNFKFLLRGTSDFDSLAGQNKHSLTWSHESSPLYADYDDGTFSTRYPVQAKAYTYKADTISYKFGDVTNDGKIDSTDASLILSAYSKLSTLGWSGFTSSRYTAGDVNKDSKLDSKDASELLGYYSYRSTGGTKSLEDYLKNQR